MLRPLYPVLRPLWRAAVRGFVAYRTFGLHPSHPDHGRFALLLARVQGGVRV